MTAAATSKEGENPLNTNAMSDDDRQLVLRLWSTGSKGYAKSLSDAELDLAEQRITSLPAARPAIERMARGYVDDPSEARPSSLTFQIHLALLRLQSERWDRIEEAKRAVTVTHVQEQPIPLFRSVSRPEMASILATGAITGRLNVWTPADQRRCVLFADRITRGVITQGEDAHRMAHCALLDHPVKKQMARAKALAAEQPDAEHRKKALRNAEARYEMLHKDLVRAEEKRRSSMRWTSAVIETVPLAGATVWPSGHRDNHMGKLDEYGMEPGAVTLGDIAAVTLIQEREPIYRGTLAEVSAYLARFGEDLTGASILSRPDLQEVTADLEDEQELAAPAF